MDTWIKYLFFISFIVIEKKSDTVYALDYPWADYLVFRGMLYIHVYCIPMYTKIIKIIIKLKIFP